MLLLIISYVYVFSIETAKMLGKGKCLATMWSVVLNALLSLSLSLYHK